MNYVDADDGVRLGKEETVIGDWALAETNCQYEWRKYWIQANAHLGWSFLKGERREW